MYTGTLALNAIHNLDLTLAADSSGGIQLLCATLNESHPRARAPQNPLLCTQVPVKQWYPCPVRSGHVCSEITQCIWAKCASYMGEYDVHCLTNLSCFALRESYCCDFKCCSCGMITYSCMNIVGVWCHCELDSEINLWPFGWYFVSLIAPQITAFRMMMLFCRQSLHFNISFLLFLNYEKAMLLFIWVSRWILASTSPIWFVW